LEAIGKDSKLPILQKRQIYKFSFNMACSIVILRESMNLVNVKSD